jgi:hypothetical protein
MLKLMTDVDLLKDALIAVGRESTAAILDDRKDQAWGMARRDAEQYALNLYPIVTVSDRVTIQTPDSRWSEELKALGYRWNSGGRRWEFRTANETAALDALRALQASKSTYILSSELAPVLAVL